MQTYVRRTMDLARDAAAAATVADLIGSGSSPAEVSAESESTDGTADDDPDAGGRVTNGTVTLAVAPAR
jgi:hypothetical protein